MTVPTPITVAYGDGIGPEIMTAVLAILTEAGAKLDLQTIEVGQKLFERGISSGIEPSAWNSLRATKVFLKAPITTPQGTGVKSLNVTIRTALGLYANVRPCTAYAPFVPTRHPGMDVVIIRENEEDLYTGIEHRQTHEVVQCLKLVSVPGCERIIRYAFEFAKHHGRKKVTCLSKDNIMKLTDGLFHKTFDYISKEYPSIQSEHWIVDIGAALIADQPSKFDVVVTTNLYGDIISDIAAQVAGSVGLGGSANIGEVCSMFEAIHGSAPTIAGQNIANPSGLLLAAVMMLVHIGQGKAASLVQNAWLSTLESGIHTADIFKVGSSRENVGTKEFAAAVIGNLGKNPKTFKPVFYPDGIPAVLPKAVLTTQHRAVKRTVGIDVFLDAASIVPSELGTKLSEIGGESWKLTAITNRGVKVWPDGFPETLCTDHWRCRFMSTTGPIEHREILELLSRISEAGFDFIKTEHLCSFDGERGFSLAQGE